LCTQSTNVTLKSIILYTKKRANLVASTEIVHLQVYYKYIDISMLST